MNQQSVKRPESGPITIRKAEPSQTLFTNSQFADRAQALDPIRTRDVLGSLRTYGRYLMDHAHRMQVFKSSGQDRRDHQQDLYHLFEPLGRFRDRSRDVQEAEITLALVGLRPTIFKTTPDGTDYILVTQIRDQKEPVHSVIHFSKNAEQEPVITEPEESAPSEITHTVVEGKTKVTIEDLEQIAARSLARAA